MDFIFRLAEEFLKKHKRLNRYRRVFAVIAAVVVFATTYELILPAITMDKRRAADTPGVEIGVAAQEEVSSEAQNAEAEEETPEESVSEEKDDRKESGAESADDKEDGKDSKSDKSSAKEDAQADAEEKEADSSDKSGDSEADVRKSSSGDADVEDEDSAKDDAENQNESSGSAKTDADTEKGSDKDDSENSDGTDSTDAASGHSTAAGTENSDQSATDAAAADPAAAENANQLSTQEPVTAYPATIVFEGKDYTITATFDEKAGLPADVRLDAVEILPDVEYKDENGNLLYPSYEEYYDQAVKAVEKEKKLEDQGQAVTTARFFDITFLDAEGFVIEPAAPVNIAVKYKDALSAVDTADTMAVHFDVDEKKSTVDEPAVKVTQVLDTKTQVEESKDKKTNEKKEEISQISFDAEKFSVYGILGTETITTNIITESGDTLQATVEVTTTKDAARFEGLRVKELTEADGEYWTAYNAVVAEKKNDENFDEDTFGFFAADIALLDADGEEFEPEGKVNVKMELISLPADAETLTSSMEVQHIAKKDGLVEVQTVATTRDVKTIDDVITAQFDVESFSTFTLTWTGDGSSEVISDDDAKAILNINSGSETYATVNIHYVDVYGNNIRSPFTTAVDGTTPVTIEGLLDSEVAGYEYQGAYLNEYTGDEITTITVDREGTSSQQYVEAGSTRDNGRPVSGWTVDTSKTYYGDGNNGKIRLYYRQQNGSSGNYRFMTTESGNNNNYRYTNGTVYTLENSSSFSYTMTFDNDGSNVATLTNQSTSIWTDAADIYLVYESTDTSLKSATIHFGYMDGTQYVEFDESTINFDTDATSFSIDTNFDNNYVYRDAIYCAPDVEFESGVDAGSTITKAGSGFEITTYTTNASEQKVESTTAIEDGSNIYAVYYIPESTPISGKDDDSVPSPTVTKNVSENGDGTYTIQLDVEGDSVTQDNSHYVNVLIVLDATKSMEGSKWTNAKAAMKTLIETMTEGDNAANAGKIDFSLVTFGRAATVVQNWTKDNAAFKTTCAGISMVSTSGTNWEAGMRGALYGVLNNMPDDDPTYVIFLTDGDPNTYYNDTSSTNYDNSGTAAGYNNGSTTSANRSKDEAKAIAAKTNLYGIYCGDSGTTPSGTSYNRLVDVIEGTGQGGKDTIAANAGTIESEFKKIAETALSNMGSNNVSIDDGITELTAVSAQVVGTAGAFEYQTSTDGETWTNWTEAPGASYTEENGVTWDLSALGTVMAGTYYRIRFTVWPSQEAYDLVADVNNGIIYNDDGTYSVGTPDAAYNSLDEETKQQIEKHQDGDYYLKTNSHLNIGYTFRDQTYVDEGTTIKEGEMLLNAEKISLEKIWPVNLLDPNEHEAGDSLDGIKDEITLTLTKDGEEYLDVTVKRSGDWGKQDVYLSCGVMTIQDGMAKVMDGSEGHDYTVIEPEIFSYYWDLYSDVFHPMIIDGDPTMLVLDEDKTIDDVDNDKVFAIGGKIYSKKDASTTLEAKNYRRSNLNLTKKVTGESAPSDELFTYDVKVTDASGRDVWFSIMDEDQNYITNTAENTYVTGATAELKEGQLTGYYYAPGGSDLTLKIKAGWNVRFINLLHGSEYEITETGVGDGFEFVSISPDTKYPFEKPVNADWYEISDKKISGTITEPNNSYNITYTNNWPTYPMNVLKVDEKNAGLAGAQFLLSRGQEAVPFDGNTDGKFITTTSAKEFSLGKGIYCLTEAKAPSGYIILSDKVYFEVEADGTVKLKKAVKTTVEGQSVINYEDAEEDYYSNAFLGEDGVTITIKNTPGHELPMTGGTGKSIYTLGGIFLAMTAALMYVFSMRRRERRLK